MKDKIELEKIIDDFLKNASEEELNEFRSILENDKKKPGMDIGIQNMASGFAENIKQQVGLTKDKISVFARSIVRDMILQYDPDIPEEKVQKLLDLFVPERIDAWKKLPREVLLSMIKQFIAFGEGKLSEEDMKEYPDGWYEKYWVFFPADLQKLIRIYLKGNITKREFWNRVEVFLPL